MAPTLAVVAYPTLGEADRAWIESVRAINDPQFGKLTGHFTLVFPVEAALQVVVAEVERIAAATHAFPFVLRSVKAVRDSVGPGGHVFLLPDEGAAQVSKLHSRLYGGALQRALQSDIPYMPHITVGANTNFVRCESLAQHLAGNLREVAGRVDRLTVIEVNDGEAAPVFEYRLAAAAAR